MKKFLIFFIGFLIICSCKKTYQKHVYVIEFKPYTTQYDEWGNKTIHEAKINYKDLGLKNDSSIIITINTLTKEYNDVMNRCINHYFDKDNRDSQDKIEYIRNKIMSDAYKSACRSLIGRRVILITVSDSLIQENPNISLNELTKKYDKLIQTYEIYDGTPIWAELEMQVEYDEIKRKFN